VSKTNTNTATAIANVRKVLSRIVPGDGRIAAGKRHGLSVKRVVLSSGSGHAVILLDDDSWLVAAGGKPNFEGFVDGFNAHAGFYAYHAADLGILSRASADLFSAWFDARRLELSKQNDLKNAQRLLEENGYRVIKRGRK
jgi:hypothetical protein